MARSEVRPEVNQHGVANPSVEVTASQEATINGEPRPADTEEMVHPATEEEEDPTRNVITPLHKSEWMSTRPTPTQITTPVASIVVAKAIGFGIALVPDRTNNKVAIMATVDTVEVSVSTTWKKPPLQKN